MAAYGKKLMTSLFAIFHLLITAEPAHGLEIN